MHSPDSNPPPRGTARKPNWQELLALAEGIFKCSDAHVPRAEFLRSISKGLLRSTGCDQVGLSRMHEGAFRYHHRAECLPDGTLAFASHVIPWNAPSETGFPCEDTPHLDTIRSAVLQGKTRTLPGMHTAGGSYWSGNIAVDLPPAPAASNCASLVVIRYPIEGSNLGLLELRSSETEHFGEEHVEFLECVARFIGIAIADHRARRALRRRVSELNCRNEIATLERKRQIELNEILECIVELLPPLFTHVERVGACIRLDDQSFQTAHLERGAHHLKADLLVNRKPRGAIEIALHTLEEYDLDAELAIADDRALLERIARQISALIERREAELDRNCLEEQLRHADRLATIGQLAAGVAHELNEPLANILGFGQLVAKGESLPPQAALDIEKIINAAIRGREIVKKLLLFARQMPARKEAIDLNHVVAEALYFLESRCAKEGIEPLRILDRDLPPLLADSSQLQQVLVNLVVNAIQATPRGGRICVETAARQDCLSLAVEDTGHGMSEEVQRQMFLPFFTTKDIGQGTGLGLPVVHGIVSAHGGTIEVRSAEGAGSRFEVLLPLNPPEAAPGEQA